MPVANTSDFVYSELPGMKDSLKLITSSRNFNQ